MTIKYIDEIALKAPQHIEDKLAALAAKATQGKWENVGSHPWFEFDRIFAGSTFICSASNTDMAREERKANADHITALHNTAPALLAVVRAARRLEEELHMAIDETDLAAIAGDDLFRALGDMRAARIALDALEV